MGHLGLASRCRQLTIITFTFLLPTGAYALESFVGVFAGRAVYFNGSRIADRKCGEWELWANLDNNTLSIRSKYDGPIEQRILLTREERTRKGIRTEHLFARDATFGGRKINIDLDRSLSEQFLSWVGEGASCPDAGWTPGALIVVVSPGSRNQLQQWAAANGSKLEDQSEDSEKNAFFVDVPVGQEYEYAAKIKTESWVLDARREGEGAGPDYSSVDFENGALFQSNEGQPAVKARLKDFLVKTFPQLNVSDDNIIPKRGFSYAFQIFAPARRLGLNDDDYAGYWLKADLEFYFTKQGSMDKASSDRMILNIRDAWLPRWPDNAPNPPPAADVSQFHLAPDGSDKLKNFYLLGKLLAKAAGAAASRWNGKADIPDYQ